VSATFRLLRAVTRHYPFLHGANLFCRLLGPLLGSRPRWAESDTASGCPPLSLDLSILYQRKMFFFPKPYVRRKFVRSPLARYMALHLASGSTFVEIGANVGVYSLLAAAHVGASGRVVAFEPEPRSAEVLRRSAALAAFEHVECFDVALSDQSGTREFHLALDATANSLVDETPARANRYRGTVTVRTTTLDALVAARGIDPRTIGLIKVDVEGEEVRTIAGMLGTLERGGGPPLWCEVRGPLGSTRAPDTFTKVAALLAPQGYAPYRCDGVPRPVAAGDVVGREDILFVAARRVEAGRVTRGPA
jgi:FkbM family methyltransferase